MAWWWEVEYLNYRSTFVFWVLLFFTVSMSWISHVLHKQHETSTHSWLYSLKMRASNKNWSTLLSYFFQNFWFSRIKNISLFVFVIFLPSNFIQKTNLSNMYFYLAWAILNHEITIYYFSCITNLLWMHFKFFSVLAKYMIFKQT